eukprot:858011-Prymnesium_polylepis.3
MSGTKREPCPASRGDAATSACQQMRTQHHATPHQGPRIEENRRWGHVMVGTSLTMLLMTARRARMSSKKASWSLGMAFEKSITARKSPPGRHGGSDGGTGGEEG